MGKRPARCYRRVSGPAYTRTARRVVKKAFIRGVPGRPPDHLDMGNARKEYDYQVVLVAEDNAQIRSEALEACRITINRAIEKKIGVENFHFQVRAYPHHVLRENAIISGAGADRLQTGMRHAFGRPKGRAARVKRGQTIFSIKVDNKKHVELARKAFKKVGPKLPLKVSIDIREISSEQK